MGSCPQWVFNLPGPASHYYPMVRSMASERGVELIGDAQAGSVATPAAGVPVDTPVGPITAHMQGRYRSEGDRISITVDSYRPDVWGYDECGAIRQRLQQGIAQLPQPAPQGGDVPEDITEDTAGMSVDPVPAAVHQARKSTVAEPAPSTPDMTFTIEEVEQWETTQRYKHTLGTLLGISAAVVAFVVYRRVT